MVSCGRPTGNAARFEQTQQPGIAAPGGQSAQARQLSQEQDKLQKKFHDLSSSQQRVSAEMTGLRAQIEQAQAGTAAVQTQMQAELAARARQSAEEDFRYRSEAQARADAESTLGAEIQSERGRIAELDSTIAQQQASGYSPYGAGSNLALREQLGRQLAELQTRYRALRRQDDQAAATRQARSRWEEGAAQAELQERYRNAYESAQKRVQSLNEHYQKLSEQDQQLRQALSDTQDQLFQLRDNLTATG